MMSTSSKGFKSRILNFLQQLQLRNQLYIMNYMVKIGHMAINDHLHNI